MTNHRLFISLVILLITLAQPGWTADGPTFNLLKADPSDLPKSQTIKVSHDPVYNKAKEYEAYQLAEILNKITVPDSLKMDELVIVFTAADGYKVAMAYSDALTEQGFIAFRDNGAENKKWLGFKFGKQTMTPAPYYLVWPKKDLDEWRYPWPFQLVSLSLQPARAYFGVAAPAAANTDAQVNRGFVLFSRYCIRCHSVNLSGGKVGPELNIPKNITEYFKEQELPKFILNASAYRAGAKMPNFSGIITTDNAQSIVHYLKHKKSEKRIKPDE
jgi:mono/diheme cytochrome c family protein